MDLDDIEPIPDYEFEEILDLQDCMCAGCNEPLTSAVADWASHTTEYEITEHHGEEPREGFLRYKRARSLGGTRQEMDDLEFMCRECMGTLTRSVRLPRFLMAGATEWLESHWRHHDEGKQDYDVRSFNHLVRVAIERFISIEDALPIDDWRASSFNQVAEDEFNELVRQMIIDNDKMKERLNRFTD